MIGRPSAGGRERTILALVTAAMLAAVLNLAPPAAIDVLAAAPDLSLTTDATYQVLPEKARVHVSLDAVAVSHTQDTVTQRYFFSGTYVTVLPGTTGFTATRGSTKLPVRVSRKTKDYVLLSVGFDHRVYSGQSFQFRLQFDLPDPGGAPTRDVRVGSSLVAFPVWAFASADTSGSTVRVVLPPGFQPEPGAGDLPAPTMSDSGETVFQTPSLAKPLDFYAYVMADRAGAFGQTAVHAQVGGRRADVLVKAWADDPAWGKLVSDLFRRGLPVLGGLIGLPYPQRGTLTVEEAVSRSLGGYSGLFDPEQGRIQVAYYAEPFVVLHEAAHAWFNSDLASDRWIDEAFASYYAQQAASRLGIKATPAVLTPTLLASRIQLNDWGAVGREDGNVESYAYAATLELATLIGRRAGASGLSRVWTAAASRESAYQPLHAGATSPDRSDLGAPDWRVLLDLLEERTGASYTDLWRTWVVRPSDDALLDDRTAARADYLATTAAAGEWELPDVVRQAMDAWQFSDAERMLADARGVLRLRDAVVARAAADGLGAPTALRRLFEAGPTFDAARTEAQRELVALGAIEAAKAAASAHPQAGVAGEIGLVGENPSASLVAAGEAFEAGDMNRTVTDAEIARAAWAGAGDVGQARLIAATASLLGAILVLTVSFLLWRRRRERNQMRAALAALSAAGRPPLAHRVPVPAEERVGEDAGPAGNGSAVADRSSTDASSDLSAAVGVRREVVRPAPSPPDSRPAWSPLSRDAGGSDADGRYATLPAVPDPRAAIDSATPAESRARHGGGDQP